MNYFEAFGVLINQFDLPLKNDDDLVAILRVRDKAFLLAKQLILSQIAKTSIMSELSSSDKEKYMYVYAGTVEYYLKKVLATFTNLASNVAEKNGVPFKEEYKRIGCFFSVRR